MPESSTNIGFTLTRVMDELKQDGRSSVHIDHEADGDEDLAERILKSAAVTYDFDISINTDGDVVYGRVLEPEGFTDRVEPEEPEEPASRAW